MRPPSRAAVVALCALAAGPLSGLGVPTAEAIGEAPELVITSPADGSVINDTTPAFHGTSTAPGDGFPEAETVIVRVYNEAKSEVLELTSSGEPGQAWTVGSAETTPLAPGTYTAIAEQSSGLFNKRGRSPAVTFTVDTVAPAVSIAPLSSPTNTSTPKIDGAAGTAIGDDPSVAVTIYSGGSVGGTIAASTTGVPVEDSLWEYVPTLADGTYTAQATQRDAAGNIGTSVPMTFIVEAHPPAPLNTAAPVILGVPQVGQALSCSSGSWTGDPAPTFRFVWLRDGASIPSANAAVYVVQPADQGHILACEVVASNIAGQRTATSAGVAIAAATSTIPAATATTTAGSPAGGVIGGLPTGAVLAVTISTTDIGRLLFSQLIPQRKATRISTLLAGRSTIRLTALTAGAGAVGWYYLPPGARLARHAKPVLVASGRRAFAAAGTAVITIKPTGAGRRLLKHANRIKLSAKGTFTPSGGAPVTRVRTFALKR